MQKAAIGNFDMQVFEFRSFSRLFEEVGIAPNATEAACATWIEVEF